MREIRTTTNQPVEARIEGEGDAKKSRLAGYAAVFYRQDDPGTEYWLWSDMVERIMPGAFDRAIKSDDVRALFNHDPNLVLGRSKASTLTLSTDETGLSYEIDPGDTQIGRDVVSHVRRGDVTGSSFSFVPTKITWSEETRNTNGQESKIWIRQIDEVTLYDVGPVTFPAYEASSSTVRNAGTLCNRSASDAENERSALIRERDSQLSGFSIHDAARELNQMAIDAV